MDEKLLAEARRAQERLIEAEHDAEVARAGFHRAVRRLHLHGGSLREVGPALGLSYQRVHQIVEAAGGSRRWSRRRRAGQNVTCSFCGCQRTDDQQFVAGPGVYICQGCAATAAGVLDTGRPAPAGTGVIQAVAVQEQRSRCSFCGQYRPQCTGLAATTASHSGKAAQPAAICGECLALCAEIIAERQA